MTQSFHDESILTLEHCGEVLADLVRMDTSQPNGHEARVIDWIAARYKGGQAQLDRIDHGDGRASLIVELPGQASLGAVAFVGHVDTVSFGPLESWHFPPLDPTIIDGQLYGRGAADMKGGVAAMMLCLDSLLAREKLPKRRILFCFTADEEAGGLGARAMVNAQVFTDTEAVIICEPTRNAIGVGEKGALWLRVTAKGVPCHASKPKLGANAITALIDFSRKASRLIDSEAAHRFLGKNSFAITQLHGGTTSNIIPAEAEMTVDIRTLPEVSHRTLTTELKTICADLMRQDKRLKLTLHITNDRPALEINENALLVQQVVRAAASLSMEMKKRGLNFYTDGSQIVPACDTPFVILGPGDDRQAHTVNEHVALADVVQFAKLYRRLINVISENGFEPES
jgi:succinyl-diaminopimelate desuccinylase